MPCSCRAVPPFSWGYTLRYTRHGKMPRLCPRRRFTALHAVGKGTGSKIYLTLRPHHMNWHPNSIGAPAPIPYSPATSTPATSTMQLYLPICIPIPDLSTAC